MSGGRASLPHRSFEGIFESTKRRPKTAGSDNGYSQEATVPGKECLIEIFPHLLSFGCVCQGFIYNLVMTVVNKGKRPQTIRITCSPDMQEEFDGKNKLRSKYEPKKIAPGMSINITLELVAEHSARSEFKLLIAQAINEAIITRIVKAHVVPLEVFKGVSKSLQLRNQPIYRAGVFPVDTVFNPETAGSIISGAGMSASAETALTEAIMDEEDIGELLDLPIIKNVYWDPRTKKLILGPILGKVLVDNQWTVEQSVEATQKEVEKEFAKLEEEGFYTIRSISKVDEGNKAGSQLESPSKVGFENISQSGGASPQSSRVLLPSVMQAQQESKDVVLPTVSENTDEVVGNTLPPIV